MSAIHDSTAFLDENRILPQHQMAISIIQGKTDNPSLKIFKWLDLGCGKGQIISNLDHNLSSESRSKIEYDAFDIKEEYITTTIKKAESLALKNSYGKTGDLEDFPNLFPAKSQYDFITFTNTIHELSPFFIPELLFETLIRLNRTGVLFIYDMENLPILELGAVTWSCDEIQEILEVFFNAAGIQVYKPRPGKWPHKTTLAWNIQLQKEYIGIDDTKLLSNKESIIATTKESVSKIILRKLDNCKKILNSFTKYGPETEDEEQTKLKLLYDFWSLTRIKENQHE